MEAICWGISELHGVIHQKTALFSDGREKLQSNRAVNRGVFCIKLNSVALVRQVNYTAERPLLVGEVTANFEDRGCRVVSATDPNGR
jgi:hypothetical protein